MALRTMLVPRSLPFIKILRPPGWMYGLRNRAALPIPDQIASHKETTEHRTGKSSLKMLLGNSMHVARAFGPDKTRVLLVEDDAADAVLMRELLSDAQPDAFVLTHASTLNEALTLLYEEAFEVVLLDLSLPDAHGLETVVRVRCSHPTIPVVVLSGFDDEQVAFEALSSGAQDYLVKGSVEPAQMRRAIRFALERKRSEQQLTYLSQFDHLTGLANRNLFKDRLDQALARAKRNTHTLALMFLDMDGFKEINDTLGHDAGDALLRNVARRISECVRQSDTVVRLGGDEFTILLEDIEHGQAAANVAEKVLAAIEEPVEVAGKCIKTKLSIGIALYPHCGEDPTTLVRGADKAMQQSKRDGGSCYHFYTEAMDAHVLSRLRDESALRAAIKNEEFVLHYQPLVDLRNGETQGMEALIRWRRPGVDDLISPAEFIPLAEKTGLIVPIGEWVIRSACAQAARWTMSGLPNCRVSVNLSARQFEDKGLVSVIERALHDSQLNPRLLELEITETALMQDLQESTQTLKILKDMGVSIAVDDFGTGYCSLTYLRQFPVDTLKMDRSFVTDVNNAVDGAIAAGIITLSHSLNLRVVAEGIETDEQLLHVKSLGPDEVQGFLIAKPQAISDVTQDAIAKVAINKVAINKAAISTAAMNTAAMDGKSRIVAVA